MTIDKDHKAQKIRLVGGVYDDTWYNWTGEGSFLLRFEPSESFSGFDPDAPTSPVPVIKTHTDYTIRFVTLEGERYVYAAPRPWPDAEALQHLFRNTLA